MNTAFVYCWTDTKTNKLYVGVHKGTTDDGYIASSKSFLKEYKERPEDFSRQIIAEGNEADMRKFEVTILQSVNARKSPDFYNLSNGDGKFYTTGPLSTETKLKMSAARKGRVGNRTGHRHSEETRAKLSASLKGKNIGRKRPDLSERNKQGLSQESLQKMVKSRGGFFGEMNPNFGKKHSDDWKTKHSERLSGENNANFGKKLSDETKMKISLAKKAYWERRKSQ